jgi:hypothetical protein
VSERKLFRYELDSYRAEHGAVTNLLQDDSETQSAQKAVKRLINLSKELEVT